MYVTTKGLVLREARYKEADRILTVLTADQGKLTVRARGALRKGSRTAAACQNLCFAEFTLFGNRGRWTADEASSVEQFLGLRDNFANLALGFYFAELLDTICAEEMPDPRALSLGLNALYALTNGLWEPERIKSVFELRLLCAEGYEPAVAVCGVCGNPELTEPMFSPDSGMAHCRACGGAMTGASLPLDREALDAMRYIVSAEPKKIFSFVLPEESEKKLHRVCETFARVQLDKVLPSLEYWKSVNHGIVRKISEDH